MNFLGAYLDERKDATGIPRTQLSATPTLARLAYNRLGFGPQLGDPDFGNDRQAFTAYVDQQLAYESIDDAATTTYVASLSRTDSQGLSMPPLDAGPAQIKQYADAFNAKANSAPDYDMAYYLTTVTYVQALLSRRQLFEVMVDFWTNHFNTVPDNVYKCWEDHYVIRQHALGNFRDLLGASAHDPLMLHFLSNEDSDGDNPNENYAREIMELHTLGSMNRIPGHVWQGKPNYTEEDVHTVAQILSGWTVNADGDGSFRFNDTQDFPTHHSAAKQLKLDNTDYHYFFPAGGIEQGEKFLDIIARHPSTAYHLAWKLCKRLISDTPETFCPGAIQAGLDAFLASQGDIRKTVRALLLYTESGHDFASSWQQKVKRPFEFFIGALRALNVTVYPPPHSSNDDISTLYDQALGLGQPLFSWPPPTGYPDVKQVWWNTNQLFGRWSQTNTLVQMAFGNQADDQPTADAGLDTLIGNTGATPPTANAVVTQLVSTFFGYTMHPDDQTNLINYLGDHNPQAPITSAHPKVRPLLATLLASPYFQWR